MCRNVVLLYANGFGERPQFPIDMRNVDKILVKVRSLPLDDDVRVVMLIGTTAGDGFLVSKPKI
jgi:hypothetical protein